MLKDRSLADKYKLMDLYTAPVKKAEREIVGREKEMTRLMAAMCRPELCNAILLADAGSGKALADDTWIPVPDACGYRRVCAIQKGDYVFDEDGNPAEVLGVYHQGPKRAYRITFADGTSVICNDEHLWAARTRRGHLLDAPYRTVTVREMLDTGVRRTRVLKNGKLAPRLRWYVPASGAVRRPDADLPVHPYALGLFLGCGWLTDGDVMVPFGDDDAVALRVADLINSGGAVRCYDSFCWKFLRPDGGHGQRYISVDYMRDLLGCSGVFGTELQDRRIPDDYMLGSAEQRRELLRGLMDACGRWPDEGGIVGFHSAGEGLARDVRTMAASLGMRTVLSERDIDIKGFAVHEHVVGFLVPGSVRPELFWSEYHKDSVRDVLRPGCAEPDTAGRRGDVAVARIEDLGYEIPMTCLYVDSPSHLFLCTKDHIVTHNTALVQGTMLMDKGREYLEVDLARMITACTTDANQMASLLKGLFDEVGDYCKSQGREVVLFIDEFHQVVQLSDAAVEALKPLLADSGTRGIRIIAATTYIEFRKYIAPNQPLVERLQRINLPEPGHDVVIAILKGMAARYDVADKIIGDGIYELIYEYTNRYIPSNAQPRKSILIMDAMIGWHRSMGRRFDDRLLGDVIYDSEGVNVSFNVDAAKIKSELDKRVLSQKFATTMIEQRLQICAADLNNKKKPMSSFLFSGATGVGKELPDSTPIPVFRPDGGAAFKRNGDLVPGDLVFNREGRPVTVQGVFPQGVKPVYEVELTDGRILEAGAKHLWTYRPADRRGADGWVMADTESLAELAGSAVIPMNRSVEWPEADLSADPYVVGAFIGCGRLRMKALCLSSNEADFIDAVGRRVGASDVYWEWRSNRRMFYLPQERRRGGMRRFQTADVLTGDAACLVGLYSREKFIPDAYKHGSVTQRWRLVHGLFDGAGHIRSDGAWCNAVVYRTSSGRLAKDIQEVLWSLGVPSRLHGPGESESWTGASRDEWCVRVLAQDMEDCGVFSLPHPLERCDCVPAFGPEKICPDEFTDVIGVRAVRRTDRTEPMTCIMVDDPEHLYQAGDFVVTHNTEITKALANLLFGSDDALLRWDMTEFANPDSLDRFRHDLTNRVWARPFSIILLDEIEKACAPVTRLLLQVLDDGRLMDENNRVVVFSNAYIVLTTNAGSEVYKNISQYNVDDEGSGKEIMKYYKVIRNSIANQADNRFPPELLGRIDVIVPFQPLSEETMKQIASMNLNKLICKIRDRHGVKVEIHKDVVRYLVEDNLDTNSDSGGARVVISKMESEVTIPIARYINEHPEARIVRVGVHGKLVRDDVNMRVSNAYIKVWDPTAPSEDAAG